MYIINTLLISKRGCNFSLGALLRMVAHLENSKRVLRFHRRRQPVEHLPLLVRRKWDSLVDRPLKCGIEIAPWWTFGYSTRRADWPLHQRHYCFRLHQRWSLTRDDCTGYEFWPWGATVPGQRYNHKWRTKKWVSPSPTWYAHAGQNACREYHSRACPAASATNCRVDSPVDNGRDLEFPSLWTMFDVAAVVVVVAADVESWHAVPRETWSAKNGRMIFVEYYPITRVYAAGGPSWTARKPMIDLDLSENPPVATQVRLDRPTRFVFPRKKMTSVRPLDRRKIATEPRFLARHSVKVQLRRLVSRWRQEREDPILCVW